MEIEAKFALTQPVEANTIEAMAWEPFTLGQRAVIDQHDTFFDTHDRALSRSRHAVRVRLGGSQPLVTFKGPNSVIGGVHTREELEAPTQDEAPRGWPADIRARVEALLGDRMAELAPLLHVHNLRHAWPLLHENRVVGEVVLDRGTIMAGDRSVPMHELEIELKGGAISDLEIVQTLVQRQLPAQPEDRSKFERGFALVAPIDAAATRKENV